MSLNPSFVIKINITINTTSVRKFSQMELNKKAGLMILTLLLRYIINSSISLNKQSSNLKLPSFIEIGYIFSEDNQSQQQSIQFKNIKQTQLRLCYASLPFLFQAQSISSLFFQYQIIKLNLSQILIPNLIPISMKRFLGFDKHFQALNSAALIGDRFDYLAINAVARMARSLCQENKLSEFDDILSILKETNQTNFSQLKSLIFLNVCVRQTQSHFLSLIQHRFEQFLNRILGFANQETKKQSKNQQETQQSSLEKVVGYLRKKLSLSKQKQIISRPVQKNMKSLNKKKEVNKKPTNKSLYVSSAQKSTHNEDIYNMDDLVRKKMIEPYCCYLFKLIGSFDLFERIRKSGKSLVLQPEEVWKIINLLKALLEITHRFDTAMRFFKVQLQRIVYVLIYFLNEDIKLFYETISQSILGKLDRVKLQIQSIEVKNQPQSKAILIDLVEKFQVNELCQIIKDMSKINDDLYSIFQGKFTAYAILRYNIETTRIEPKFNNCDYLYQLLEKYGGKNQTQYLSHQSLIQKFLTKGTPINLKKLKELKKREDNQNLNSIRNPTFRNLKINIISSH